MSDSEKNRTPEGLTPQQELIVRLVEAVPRGHWVSFGDLAEAMQELGQSTSDRAVTDALHRYTTQHSEEQVEMNLWGRVRNEQGYVVWAEQGTDRPHGSGVVANPDDPSNVAFEAAGGLIDGVGRAATSRRYPLASTIRREQLGIESRPEDDA